MLADATQHQLLLVISSSSSRHYAVWQQNIFCTLVFQSASVARLTFIKFQHSSKPVNVKLSKNYTHSVYNYNAYT